MASDQYYISCVKRGSYKSKAKNLNPLKNVFIINSGCEARIYAKFREKNVSGEDRIIIADIKNIHYHQALSEKQHKFSPASL